MGGIGGGSLRALALLFAALLLLLPLLLPAVTDGMFSRLVATQVKSTWTLHARLSLARAKLGKRRPGLLGGRPAAVGRGGRRTACLGQELLCDSSTVENVGKEHGTMITTATLVRLVASWPRGAAHVRRRFRTASSRRGNGRPYLVTASFPSI